MPIDNTLVEAPGNAYAVENAAGSYTASLPENPATTPVRVEADGVWVTMKMNGVSDDPAIDGSVATYDDVTHADSVTYQATNTGLKEDVVLSAAPPAGQPLVYTYTLAASEGVTPSVSAIGSVAFTNAAGDVVMEIPRGNMIDSATPQAEMTGAVTYTLDAAESGWTLTMTPDLPWLTDPSRVYPVRIDPTLTTGVTRDCWIIKSNLEGAGCGDVATHIRTGRKNADDVYRGLLKFDVSSIPATATVNAATVSLFLAASQSYSNEISSYGFQLAGKPWGRPTWNTTGISTTTWNGGDPTGDVNGVRNLDGQSEGFKEFTGLGPWVQGWANGTIPNDGLVLKQVNEDTNNVLWFKSSSPSEENDGQRPYLEVTYMKPNKAPNIAGKPTIVPWRDPTTTTPRPTISSVVSDPDGDPTSIRVRILDRVGEPVWEGHSSEVPSGSTASVRVPSGVLAVGSRYSVSVMASDGRLDASSWSETQAFRVVAPPHVKYDRTATVESDDVVTDDPAPEGLDYSVPTPSGGAWFTRDSKGRRVKVLSSNPSKQSRGSFFWDSVCTNDEHRYSTVMDYRRSNRDDRMVGDVARMYCGKEARSSEGPYSEAAFGIRHIRDGYQVPSHRDEFQYYADYGNANWGEFMDQTLWYTFRDPDVVTDPNPEGNRFCYEKEFEYEVEDAVVKRAYVVAITGRTGKRIMTAFPRSSSNYCQGPSV